jgi:palmitoyltransferase
MLNFSAFKFFVQFTMYTFWYCGVVLGAAGSTLRKKLVAGTDADPHLIAILAIGGFYGLFTFLMTVTSWRYIVTNMTNVDMLGARKKVYQLAVRIPRGDKVADKYQTVTYPLPKAAENNNGLTPAHSLRDDLAIRTFAILKTHPGENPWDLGVWKNWQEVMGTNILDWLLPIRKSPCVDHDAQETYYRMDKMLRNIRTRYGIDEVSADETDRMELRNIQRNGA